MNTNSLPSWKQALLGNPAVPILLRQFNDEIWVNREDVDPGAAQDWLSLTYGWAIAKGLSVTIAHHFAVFMTHDLRDDPNAAANFGLALAELPTRAHLPLQAS